MKELSVFMKRRIQQLMEEYEDPNMVLEQLKDITKDMNEDQERELMEYLNSVWMETPNENFRGQSPEKMFEELFGSKLDINSFEGESDLLDQLMDMMKENVPEPLFALIQKASEKSEESKRKLKKGSFDLSSYKDTIKRLPLIDDMRQVVKLLETGKPYIKMTKEETPYKKDIQRLTDCLSNSHFITSKTSLFGYYLPFLLRLMEWGELLDKEDRKLSLTDFGRSLLTDAGFPYDKFYYKLFIEWWFAGEWILFSDYDTDYENLFDYAGQEYVFIPPSLYIGTQWKDAGEVLLPIMTLSSYDYRMDLQEQLISPSDINYELQSYIKSDFQILETLGLWEKKIDENHYCQIRLTQMGSFILKELLKSYHPICRMQARALFLNELSCFVDGTVLSLSEGELDLQGSREYQDFLKSMQKMESFFSDFTQLVINYQKYKDKINEYENSANRLFDEVRKQVDILTNVIKLVGVSGSIS